MSLQRTGQFEAAVFESPVIRPAVIADARGIAEMHIDAWCAAYSGIVPQEYLESLSVDIRETGWARMIERGTVSLCIATFFGKISGLVSFGPCRDSEASPSVGEVMALYVAPKCWSRGVGRSLWLTAKRHLQMQGFTSVMVWTLAENDRARRFYTAAGFIEKPTRDRTITIGGKQLDEKYYEVTIGEML